MAPNQSKPEDHGTWINVDTLPKIIEVLRRKISFETRCLMKWQTKYENYEKIHARSASAEALQNIFIARDTMCGFTEDINKFQDELEILETMLNVFLALNELEASCKGKNGGNSSNNGGNDGSGSGGVGGAVPTNVATV